MQIVVTEIPKSQYECAFCQYVNNTPMCSITEQQCELTFTNGAPVCRQLYALQLSTSPTCADDSSQVQHLTKGEKHYVTVPEEIPYSCTGCAFEQPYGCSSNENCIGAIWKPK